MLQLNTLTIETYEHKLNVTTTNVVVAQVIHLREEKEVLIHFVLDQPETAQLRRSMVGMGEQVCRFGHASSMH